MSGQSQGTGRRELFRRGNGSLFCAPDAKQGIDDGRADMIRNLVGVVRRVEDVFPLAGAELLDFVGDDLLVGVGKLAFGDSKGTRFVFEIEVASPFIFRPLLSSRGWRLRIAISTFHIKLNVPVSR